MFELLNLVKVVVYFLYVVNCVFDVVFLLNLVIYFCRVVFVCGNLIFNWILLVLKLFFNMLVVLLIEL